MLLSNEQFSNLPYIKLIYCIDQRWFLHSILCWLCLRLAVGLEGVLNSSGVVNSKIPLIYLEVKAMWTWWGLYTTWQFRTKLCTIPVLPSSTLFVPLMWSPEFQAYWRFQMKDVLIFIGVKLLLDVFVQDFLSLKYTSTPYSILFFFSEMENLFKKFIWCWEQNQNLCPVWAQSEVWLTLNWVVPPDGWKWVGYKDKASVVWSSLLIFNTDILLIDWGFRETIPNTAFGLQTFPAFEYL